MPRQHHVRARLVLLRDLCLWGSQDRTETARRGSVVGPGDQREPPLGKQTLYRLSYSRSRGAESTAAVRRLQRQHTSRPGPSQHIVGLAQGPSRDRRAARAGRRDDLARDLVAGDGDSHNDARMQDPNTDRKASGTNAPDERVGGSITRGFLFADLRGYTRFVETRGAATAADLLLRYRALVRGLVGRIRRRGDPDGR